jgi:hypothetical protein
LRQTPWGQFLIFMYIFLSKYFGARSNCENTLFFSCLLDNHLFELDGFKVDSFLHKVFDLTPNCLKSIMQRDKDFLLKLLCDQWNYPWGTWTFKEGNSECLYCRANYLHNKKFCSQVHSTWVLCCWTHLPHLEGGVNECGNIFPKTSLLHKNSLVNIQHFFITHYCHL